MLHRVLGLLLLAAALPACAAVRQAEPPLETVPYVDLTRYVGTWYEVASIPTWWQRGCVGTSARYALGGDGEIAVVNRCREESFEGPERIASAEARVVDHQTNAKLEVSFVWPFWGDYWIIDLDPNYRWAVVGQPSRDYAWILSRGPRLDDAIYQGILERLRQKGYDVSRLERTRQP